MSHFACPQCAATYRVERKTEPSEHEPHCEECDESFPDDQGEMWLHYRRSNVLAAGARASSTSSVPVPGGRDALA